MEDITLVYVDGFKDTSYYVVPMPYRRVYEIWRNEDVLEWYDESAKKNMAIGCDFISALRG